MLSLVLELQLRRTPIGDQLLSTVMPTLGASVPASTEVFFPEVNHEATLKIVAPYGAYPVINGFERIPEPGRTSWR